MDIRLFGFSLEPISIKMAPEAWLVIAIYMVLHCIF